MIQSIIIHERYDTIMRDSGCPPFKVILAYLVCIIFSSAMIGWLQLWLAYAKPAQISFTVLISFLIFGIIIIYSFFQLVRELFPERWKRRKELVMVKVLEIDGVEVHK